jgi:hypothetical protein
VRQRTQYFDAIRLHLKQKLVKGLTVFTPLQMIKHPLQLVIADISRHHINQLQLRASHLKLLATSGLSI